MEVLVHTQCLIQFRARDRLQGEHTIVDGRVGVTDGQNQARARPTGLKEAGRPLTDTTVTDLQKQSRVSTEEAVARGHHPQANQPKGGGPALLCSL